MEDKDLQPLNDLWDTYTGALDNAVASGLVDDQELNESYVWPLDLDWSEWEQSDVKRYVHNRMTEIIERVQAVGGLDPNVVAGYIFRSVVVGMMWQQERIGR